MWQRFGWMLPLAALWVSGCGGGGTVQLGDPTLRDALNEFQVALGDASGTVDAAQTPRTQAPDASDAEEQGEDDRPEDMIRSVAQLVQSSAEHLVRTAAGHAAENDVKTILADAQEIARKASGSASAAEVKQAIEQLRTKAESMKTKL